LRTLTEPHWQVLYWHLVLFAYIYPGNASDVPPGVWRELTESFNQSVAAPSKNQAFRGTLIDPKMFAIDVNEEGQRDPYRELWESYRYPLRETNTTRSRE